MNGHANSLAYTCTAIAAAFLWNCSSLPLTGLSYYCVCNCDGLGVLLSAIAFSCADNIFGCDLSKLVEVEGSNCPKFLVRCMEEIEKRGRYINHCMCVQL